VVGALLGVTSQLLRCARAAELAGEQLARWCAGEELHNIVRRGTG
jgi:hypothetical protein